jgi:hypothetical protein
LTSPRATGKIAGNTTMYEQFPDSSVQLTTETGFSVHRVVHEMDALQAAHLAIDERADAEGARLLCRTYLKRLDAETVEERVIEAALLRLLGRPVESFVIEPSRETWEAYVSETVALSWCAWAAGDNARALDLVRSLRSKQKREEVFTGKTGAIHLLTLSFWSEAVRLLVQEDTEGAKRFFKRAIELGSQFGTDSHPMISWAYAASFFPK